MRWVDSEERLEGQCHTTKDLSAILAPVLGSWKPRFETAELRSGDDLYSEHFFARLGVSQRSLVVDPADPDRWWQRESSTNPLSRAGARAYLALMERHRPLDAGDRLIIVSNVFDTHAPGLGVGVLTELIRADPRFVSPSLLPLSGDGCSGFISAMREADLWLRANPKSRVAVVSSEVCSPFFWRPTLLARLEQAFDATTDSARRMQLARMVRSLMIQRVLFGDGSVAVLFDNADDDGLRFNSFDRWTNLRADDRELLKVVGIGTDLLRIVGADADELELPTFGFFHQDARRLGPRLAEGYLPRARRVLDEMPLRPRAYALHAGSGAILDLVQSALGLEAADMAASRELLAEAGNLNSATGAAIVHRLHRAGARGPTMCVFFGVGLTLQVAY